MENLNLENDKVKIFLEGARLLSESEREALESSKRLSESIKSGLWIELDCAKGRCKIDKDTIALKVDETVAQETKGVWLSLFCPDGQCIIKESTDIP
jgi:hypothetical protein